MLNSKLIEILTEGEDQAMAIATSGESGPHLINTWNHFVIINEKDQLLIPAGRMNRTEQNLKENDKVLVTATNRQVRGNHYTGCGMLISGRAALVSEGKDYEVIKERFDWARAALVITIETIEQTL